MFKKDSVDAKFFHEVLKHVDELQKLEAVIHRFVEDPEMLAQHHQEFIVVSDNLNNYVSSFRHDLNAVDKAHLASVRELLKPIVQIVVQQAVALQDLQNHPPEKVQQILDADKIEPHRSQLSTLLDQLKTNIEDRLSQEVNSLDKAASIVEKGIEDRQKGDYWVKTIDKHTSDGKVFASIVKVGQKITRFKHIRGYSTLVYLNIFDEHGNIIEYDVKETRSDFDRRYFEYEFTSVVKTGKDKDGRKMAIFENENGRKYVVRQDRLRYRPYWLH